ncbi:MULTISPECIES: FkbM family methyltransferase [Sphingobacterium]|jgi:FkbM family methyltransferase|uniref:FkbM family methyltransferase n=1 Tax=Sphingobacterium kitahiroshimense TaxID=470446 RepID=A0ABV0BW61_9SPHI|nr:MULTISPECIES: FkbM family methyltransferase [Sphingobacterium]MBB2949619.1 FkbM family methyltransferase [Sphingobacterium sp. JUb56]MCS3554343.1 FkbM family methyltransferase [Sphingobacterium sp. JUb21]MCW2263423.1 FkbM family methyltransferase [Sphingobacterium kitahiroshimense]NJI74335.1 FkbM family methyltransferase [Sphingobacterium sp. B16(2022)]QQD14219.1 FkbM family methyltransferase [Sphingobacterium sp. UDSM-2020]
MSPSLINTLKKQYKILSGKISSFKIEHKCPHVWYGNSYGGFFVNPDLLHPDAIVYSFGIGQDTSFDDAIIQKHNCHVHGYDPTPKSIEWIAQRSDLSPKFHFHPFGLDKETRITHFNLPKNKEHVSGSIINHQNVDENNMVEVQMKSLIDIVSENNHSYIDVLKMDIEGSEYCVIESILNSSIEIRQILLEIHERFFDNGIEKTKELLNSLHQHGYKVFGISDTLEEISFIKVSS